jgi:hypothetical protein
VPQFRLPFTSKALAITPDQLDAMDFSFPIAAGDSAESDPVDVKGRATKTFIIDTDKDLTGYVYIIPDERMPDTAWILYKTLTITALANVPFVTTITDAFPFVALKLTNAGNAAASVRAFIYAQ